MEETNKNIAVIGLFSKETSDRIQKLRLEIAEKFDVHDALNWPPHLTLRPGFIVPSQQVQDLTSQLKDFISPIHPIKLTLSGFKFFDDAIVKGTVKNPYVATIDVINGVELSAVNKKLLQFELYSAQQARSFNPHVTLAYNDVSKDKFDGIKSYLADKVFYEECIIDAIGLFENTGLGTKRKMLAEIRLSEK